MKHQLRAAIAALVLAACGSAPGIASVAEFEMELDANGHIRVPVMVGNEGTFDFILDTAASRTVVMSTLVEELAWVPLQDDRAVVSGTTGQVDVRLYEPVPLSLGQGISFTPEYLPGLNPLSIEGDPFYGILGSNLFEAYVVEFDAPGERLRFAGSATELTGHRARQFATADLTEIVEGIWSIEVMVGEVPVLALLDAGARQSMMNRAAAEALGITLPPTPAPGQGDRIAGASGHTMQGVMLQIGYIAVGEREWREALVSVADLHVFDVIGRADQPTMILASDLLFDGRLVVNYADAEVLVEIPN